MISIGMFSKINKITVKALRHYDEIGIIHPIHVDRETGYRYYSTEQLPRMHRIINLKQMGLSLEEIKAALENESAIADILTRKEKETEAQILSDKSRLSAIQSYLGLLKGESNNMSYDVIIKEIPECIVASHREVIADYSVLFHLTPEVVGPAMERAGCVCAVPEYCYNVYHETEYKDTNIDVEICQAVTEMKDDTDILNFKIVDRVPTAACILHKGSYGTMIESYGKIMKWIEDNGYTIVGNSRESFIDGIWNKESEDDWLTEIQFPVTK